MNFEAKEDRELIINKSVPFYEELEKCSKCGFCQAFCPVYAVTGREPEVARGRNVQLLGVLRGELSISEIEPALSTCLLCRACVPSCFTGVKTDELIRAGRESFVNAGNGGVIQEIVFNSVLPYPVRVAVLLKVVFFFKRIGFASLANKIGILPKSLRTASLLMETQPRSFFDFRPSPQPCANLGKAVAYFRSCGFNYLFPEAGEATIKLIEGLGYEVVIPENNCCGLPPYAHGYTDAARKLARKNIEALEKFETVLTECGSCSSFLKKYSELFSDDPEYAERARKLSERIMDSNEFFFKHLNIGAVPISPPLNPPLIKGGRQRGGKVTYHDPCHLSRYQGITREPREIIKSIPGIEFVELPEADWCCGGAGTYSITNNEISMKILERKMNNVRKTGADILATSCPACMIQLSYGVKKAGLNVRVMHLNQLFNLTTKPS